MVVLLYHLTPSWVSSVYPYLRFAQHTTPASLQPLRVSLRKVLWWILTLEVLWRSPDLAWMPDPRFPLMMLSAASTFWALTSTMPPRPSRMSFFRWPLANTRLLMILLLGPLQDVRDSSVSPRLISARSR